MTKTLEKPKTAFDAADVTFSTVEPVVLTVTYSDCGGLLREEPVVPSPHLGIVRKPFTYGCGIEPSGERHQVLRLLDPPWWERARSWVGAKLWQIKSKLR